MHSELEAEDKSVLLLRLRAFCPSVKYSTQNYDGFETQFADKCSCYSEWTTQPCSLYVSLCAVLPPTDKEQWVLRRELKGIVEKFVNEKLTWSGCECCAGADCEDDYLYVDVNLFDICGEDRV